MSANRHLKEKPIVGHLAVLGITLISVFTTYALNKNEASIKKIDGKADIEDVYKADEEIKQYVYKADDELKKYVDNRFDRHIVNEQQAYNSLEKLMKSYLDGQHSIIESIDKRLERIENKQ